MVTYQEWIYLISDLPIPLYDLKTGKRLSKEIERINFEIFKENIKTKW